MAASATNTSRELGAVFGVAILGSIVNARLDRGPRRAAEGHRHPALASRASCSMPSPAAGSARGRPARRSSRRTRRSRKIATKVVQAAYNAFGSGLHTSLEISGGLLCAGAVVAAITVRNVRGRGDQI